MKSAANVMGTRFIITLLTIVALAAMSIISLVKTGNDTVTIQCISAITVIIPIFIAGDTVRRSGSDRSIISRNDPEDDTPEAGSEVR